MSLTKLKQGFVREQMSLAKMKHGFIREQMSLAKLKQGIYNFKNCVCYFFLKNYRQKFFCFKNYIFLCSRNFNGMKTFSNNSNWWQYLS